MKLQRISLQDRALLQKLVLGQLHDLDGGINLLDADLSSDAGPVCLAIDEEGRLVFLIFSVNEDDAILVKVLGQLNWAVRHQSLLARAFSNSGVVSSQSPRALLIAPSYSAVFKQAVTFLGQDIELHQYQALELDGQRVLLLDPVVVPPRKKAPPILSASVRPPVSSSHIELTDEERNFFEGTSPQNLPV
jgi:hypothetical protein